MERSERPQAQCRRSASARLRSEHRENMRDVREVREVREDREREEEQKARERDKEKKQEASLPPARMQVKFVISLSHLDKILISSN